jgi:hypothetical protein
LLLLLRSGEAEREFERERRDTGADADAGADEAETGLEAFLGALRRASSHASTQLGVSGYQLGDANSTQHVLAVHIHSDGEVWK